MSNNHTKNISLKKELAVQAAKRLKVDERQTTQLDALYLEFSGLTDDNGFGLGPLFNSLPFDDKTERTNLNHARLFPYAGYMFIVGKGDKGEEIFNDYGPNWQKKLKQIKKSNQTKTKECESPEQTNQRGRPKRLSPPPQKYKDVNADKEAELEEVIKRSKKTHATEKQDQLNKQCQAYLYDTQAKRNLYKENKERLKLEFSKEKGFYIVALKDFEETLLGIYCPGGEIIKKDQPVDASLAHYFETYAVENGESYIIPIPPKHLKDARATSDPIEFLKKTTIKTTLINANNN